MDGRISLISVDELADIWTHVFVDERKFQYTEGRFDEWIAG